MRCSAWFVLLLATIDVASPLRASKAVTRPGALRRPRWQISRGGGDEKGEKKPGAAGKIGGALKRVEPVTRCYLVTVLICTVIHQLAGDEAVKVGCARAPPACTLARTPLFLTKCTLRRCWLADHVARPDLVPAQVSGARMRCRRIAFADITWPTAPRAVVATDHFSLLPRAAQHELRDEPLLFDQLRPRA